MLDRIMKFPSNIFQNVLLERLSTVSLHIKNKVQFVAAFSRVNPLTLKERWDTWALDRLYRGFARLNLKARLWLGPKFSVGPWEHHLIMEYGVHSFLGGCREERWKEKEKNTKYGKKKEK